MPRFSTSKTGWFLNPPSVDEIDADTYAEKATELRDEAAGYIVQSSPPSRLLR
jgi:hypothetical protein